MSAGTPNLVAQNTPSLVSQSDRFKIIRSLGEGGIGVVYEALDRQRGARVALKVLHRLEAGYLLRFKNEFRLLQGLDHPHLVNLGELIGAHGQWFFTMELIDGIHFLAYVRGDPRPECRGRLDTEQVRGARRRRVPPINFFRLRHALAQVTEALITLHAAGIVHRDVKPSNILVTREDRAVLLDFGLCAEAGEPSLSNQTILGTAGYMAPEQAVSRRTGAEADWYSVGALLYEALTGQLPFEGPAVQILMRKQEQVPQHVAELRPGAPDDLTSLCMDLLATDPAHRPGGGEILGRLRGRTAALRRRVTLGGSRPVAFVGRRRELSLLHRARAEVGPGRPVTVLVRGPSGVGKTTLVRKFARAVESRNRRALSLVGRCYERESVPYKGFDGVVDSLARHLARLSAADLAELLPANAGLLLPAFPVLRGVDAIARTTVAQVKDPQELRARTVQAIRELFARLAARFSLLVVIDDLQWTDRESLELLAQILAPPSAPAVCFVALLRPLHRPGAEIDAATAIQGLPGKVQTIDLEPLPAEDAGELALQLAARAPNLGHLDLREIAEEAGGHPLFIDELVRHHAIAVAGKEKPGLLRLDDVVWDRVARLPAATRRLLELVVVAGAPSVNEAVALAVGIGFSAFCRHSDSLRAANLVRTTGMRPGDAIEPYHERIRQAVVERLDQATRREYHRRLAVGLEQSSRGDPETLLAHWRDAGDAARAAAYAVQAGDRAAEALALGRAAQLYRLALELAPETNALAIHSKLGEALANAGRGAEAADSFFRAARLAAHKEQSLDFKHRAAEQLLMSGHIDDGLTACKEVLGPVGLTLPETPQRALLSLLLRRGRIRLRGLGTRMRQADQISSSELRRIDICYAVSRGLGMVDPIRGADFQTRYLLLALGAGEPCRLSCALALEAAYTATAGRRAQRRAARLLHRARELANATPAADQPVAVALWKLCRAIVSGLNGRWKESLDASDRAAQLFRERCQGRAWEIGTAHVFSLVALEYSGELRELRRRLPRLIADARARGDLYAEGCLSIRFSVAASLAGGDTDQAMAADASVIKRWSHRGYHLQHYWDLVAQGERALYRGCAGEGLELLQTQWRDLDRSMLLRIEQVYIHIHHLRARCLLAAAAATSSGARSRALLRAATRDARRIAATGAAWGRPVAELIGAAVFVASGHSERAAESLVTAIRGFRGADMNLYAAVARRRLGQLRGGGSGARHIHRADQWMSGQGIVEPARVAALLAPGFAD